MEGRTKSLKRRAPGRIRTCRFGFVDYTRDSVPLLLNNLRPSFCLVFSSFRARLPAEKAEFGQPRISIQMS